MNNRIIRPDAGELRSPLAGKIKYGEKRMSATGKEYPVALDYFIATGQYAKLFTDALGEKPTKIPIIFISDNALVERWEGRDGSGKLVGYGDGESYFLYKEVNKVGKYANVSKDEMQAYSKTNAIKWSPVLTMTFIIPAIRGLFACWSLTTKGDASSIPNLIGSYDQILKSAKTVINIPFELTISKHKSQSPGGKSYPVLNLICNVSLENINTIKAFVESGTMPSMLLSEANLSQMKQLSAPDHDPEPNFEEAEEV